MPARVLLTGSGGFLGHHTLEHLLINTDWDIVCTDSFRHRGKTDRIAQVLEGHGAWRERVQVVTHDLCAPFSEQMARRLGRLDYIIAAASESHVDRSIADPAPFIRNNTEVALTTLELARQIRPKCVIWVSTDEVYGHARMVDGKPFPHTEWSPILPSNPYSASKAAQEAVCISYWRTFGVPVAIVNCMNLFGERQDPEKYLAKLIKGISAGEEITVHGTRGNIGSRTYLHARNLADGMLYILRELPPAMWPAHAGPGAPHGERPDRYNIVTPDQVTNLELAKMVAARMDGRLRYRLVDFHSARPGHDPHYGLDHTKLTGLGWKPPVPFAESLTRTVKWTLEHPEWIS